MVINGKRLGCTLLVLFCLNSLADLLPPQAAGMAERYQSNPRTYDRSDQWCNGKAVADSCQIPGNTFEGGGSGTCDRLINRNEYLIDLLCVVVPRPRIDRQLSDSGWNADTQLCELATRSQSTAQALSAQGWGCEKPVEVPDQFCKTLASGQACNAELSMDGQKQLYAGICKSEAQTKRGYYQGSRTLTRSILLCQPVTPVPPTTLTPVSAWRKLVQ